MPIDRTGQTFGQLTVLQDSADSDQLICRCKCGREGLYPRTISKPSYKGRLMCAWCAGSPCVICGNIIPAKPGHPAATCSDTCAADHIKRRGRDYYERVKGSERWRNIRVAYLAHIANRVQADPDFAARRAQAQRAAVQRHRAKLTPTQQSVRLEKGRQAARKALEQIRQCGGYAAYLAKHRKWYAALSDEDYQRIYHRPRGSTRKRKDD